MTYCLAITLDEGLVFASDSRTNAGADQVSTYSKMHTFGVDGERQVVLLSAGNLATTQAVIAQAHRDIATRAEESFLTVSDLGEAADYLGRVIRDQEEKHGAAVTRAGFSAEATFIMGGQIGGETPRLYLVYPQGNYITTSEQTPYLQVGETKYGKAILDRIITHDMDLDAAARCALVSLDSTMRSNATVGPPIEVLAYRRGSLRLENYLCLSEENPYLIDLRRSWNEKMTRAFRELPYFQWSSPPPRPGGG